MGNGRGVVCLFALWASILNAVWLPEVAAESSDKTWPGADVIGEVVQPGLPASQNYLEIGSDCYLAPMSLNGLQCDREGYFITDFSESVWWDPGQLFPQDWLRVPASQAMCCRVDLSAEDMASEGDINISPVGVISVGCHTSTNTGMRAMQCETEGNSFISGFLNSLSPLRAPNTFYPIDGPECCTPVVLLENGDAWSIERCDCTTSSGDISCNVIETGRMLWGFEFSGKTGKHVVPLAPAMCCKMCLGNQLHSLSSCVDQNNCSGNGACIMGSCSCRPGFAGEDCSKSLAKDTNQWWQSFWWLVVIGFLCAFMGLFATFWLIQRAEWGSGDRSNPPEDGLEDPFLDPEGSAGSIDTQSENSVTSVQINVEIGPELRGPSENADPVAEADGEVDRIEERGIRISTRIRRSNGDDGYAGDDDVYATPHASLPLSSSAGDSPGDLDGGVFDRLPGSQSSASPRDIDEGMLELSGSENSLPARNLEGGGFDRLFGSEEEEEEDGELRESVEVPGGVGSSSHFDRSADSRARRSPVSDEEQEGAEEEEEEGEIQGEEKGGAMLEYHPQQNPLGGMACAICFSRPVQIALVPCGHSNICRRCSRKLQTCPFCRQLVQRRPSTTRKEILRRQKLFLTN